MLSVMGALINGAKQRLRAWRAVQWHVVAFVVVASTLLAIDLAGDGEGPEWWSGWPIGAWALLVLAHLLTSIGRIETPRSRRRDPESRAETRA